VDAAEAVSSALRPSLPIAIVRLRAREGRLRFVLGRAALPDGSTLMFSMVGAM
jgi:hypothetical protein